MTLKNLIALIISGGFLQAASTSLATLEAQTQRHIHYLQGIGLGERAKSIAITPLDIKIIPCDLSPFEARTRIPQEALDFDPRVKNTLITTDPNFPGNNPDDVEKILDIRLYPVLRALIKENKTDVFLGTKQEMAYYYTQQGFKPLAEFKIPSSATYYLWSTPAGALRVVMAGLVSRENIAAQMITLKLAEIDITTIDIIGDIDHFKRIVHKDIAPLLPILTKGKHVLIVAGCGLEEKVSNLVKTHIKDLGPSIEFKGDIISLIYMPLSKPKDCITGIISLNLNYGEIMEEITTQLLEQAQCIAVFSGGAGGYLSHDSKPAIGTRVSVTQCLNEQGELVSVGRKTDPVHLQIPSIFLETYEWLENAKKRGSSVDVETFYILRAIRNYTRQGHKVLADCGCFISDYVGEQPLRDYSKVFEEYETALTNFLQRLF